MNYIIYLVMFLTFSFSADEAKAKTAPDVACWEMIENAAVDIRRPASAQWQDALQEAYVKVFQRCMEASINPEEISPEKYKAYILRSASNLRISAFRKYDARNIGEIFETRQKSVRMEAGNPTVDPTFLMSPEKYYADIGSGISDEMAAAHISVAIANTLSEAEIRTKILRIVGVPVSKIHEASGVPVGTIYDRAASADKKLNIIFSEFTKFWTLDRLKNYPLVIIFHALAAALVFILGAATVSSIREAFTGTPYEKESENFYKSQEEMKKNTEVAKSEAIIVLSKK